MVEKLSQAMGLKKLYSISFGLFASLFLLWLLFNSASFVPEGQDLKFTLAFLGYGILGSYVFARQDIQSKLAKVKLISAIPVFLVCFVLVYFLFVYLFGLYDLFPNPLFVALVGVPFYLQALNVFVFATIETSFWQGLLDRKLGILGSILTAGFFHMFIWDGTLLLNFIGASVLFFVFSLVNFYARRYVSSGMALIIVIAVHSAFNLIKYLGV